MTLKEFRETIDAIQGKSYEDKKKIEETKNKDIDIAHKTYLNENASFKVGDTIKLRNSTYNSMCKIVEVSGWQYPNSNILDTCIYDTTEIQYKVDKKFPYCDRRWFKQSDVYLFEKVPGDK
jgi:hypothetical protein